MTNAQATAFPTCREIADVITEYLDGLLDPSIMAGIDAHLAGCHACQAYLAQLRATIELTGALLPSDVDALPEPTRSDLLEAFRSALSG